MSRLEHALEPGKPETEPDEQAGLQGIPGEGDIVAGKYAVEHLLGVGGMGVVLSARHRDLGSLVAMKFLTAEASRAPERAARLLREARTCADLHSEHVARVLDFGALENGIPFLVMEHLHGSDLDALLTKRGPLPVPEAVDYVLQALEGIAEAHARGVVHRDLKPSNLFITRRPDGSPLVKVLDFGISKITRSEPLAEVDGKLTSEGALLGSPYYMSPEQIRDTSAVGSQTDIWSLGVILHELVSGERPFDGDTVPAILAAIVADPPKRLRQHRPDAPEALEFVVLGCLEKDPRRRVSDVAALAYALEPFSSITRHVPAQRVSKIIASIPPAPAEPSSHAEAAMAASLDAAITDSLVDEPTTRWSGPATRSESRPPSERPLPTTTWSTGRRRWLGLVAATLLVGGTAILLTRAPRPSADGPGSASSVATIEAQGAAVPRGTAEPVAPAVPMGTAAPDPPVSSASAVESPSSARVAPKRAPRQPSARSLGSSRAAPAQSAKRGFEERF